MAVQDLIVLMHSTKPLTAQCRQTMSGRGSKATAGGDDTVIRIPPHYYIHVLDLKTNVTKPIIGPETFVRQVILIQGFFNIYNTIVNIAVYLVSRYEDVTVFYTFT